MRFNKSLCFLLLAILIAAPSFATTQKSHKKVRHTGQSPHIHRPTGKRSRKNVRGGWKHRGQQQISSDRVHEIQVALIREHYLDGQPTGVFDQRTKSALAKLQGDQGWQTKVVPDSRALIKLGLGPTHEGAINLEATSDKTSAILKNSDASMPQQ